MNDFQDPSGVRRSNSYSIVCHDQVTARPSTLARLVSCSLFAASLGKRWTLAPVPRHGFQVPTMEWLALCVQLALLFEIVRKKQKKHREREKQQDHSKLLSWFYAPSNIFQLSCAGELQSR